MSNIDKKSQSNFEIAIFGLLLDRALPLSLQAQLTAALRNLLLAGQGFSGARLPSSRLLAQELSVSRTTIVSAYDQLISEGYLRTKTGGGTFVADHLPHLSSPQRRPEVPPEPSRGWLPFHPGVPDQTIFPYRRWSRHLERAWANPARDLLARPDPFGWYPLRQAISAHLGAWRKLECRPEQVMITSGATEAFDLVFQGLLEPEQTVAVEDPGWPVMRHVLELNKAQVSPVRIDANGLDAARITPSASVAIVTPSRHYPTGTAMPLARRMALLEWAEKAPALIIEDDYDSEFRYQGHPLPSLAGLDHLQRSIYLGSFSKLLSPALRIGYLVLPEKLVPKAKAYVTRFGARASLVPQPALATFMDSGEFAVHLRRMRRTYAKRQHCLVSQFEQCADVLDVRPDPSGMHICASLGQRLLHTVTDQDIVAAAKAQSLHLRALSSHCSLSAPPQGLILGYAAFDETALVPAARRLRQILQGLV